MLRPSAEVGVQAESEAEAAHALAGADTDHARMDVLRSKAAETRAVVYWLRHALAA